MKNKEVREFSEEEATEELKKGYKKAEKILDNEDKLEKFLGRLENKLKKVPVAGDVLSMVPVMISMLRSYFKKEYKDIPLGTLIALISGLLYWLTPADAIPDFLPVIGYIDDATVIGVCLKLINDDLKDYKKWRDKKDSD
jgi:uncharacterized membrane protein YkvA (DUF1232 family)